MKDTDYTKYNKKKKTGTIDVQLRHYHTKKEKKRWVNTLLDGHEVTINKPTKPPAKGWHTGILLFWCQEREGGGCELCGWDGCVSGATHWMVANVADKWVSAWVNEDNQKEFIKQKRKLRIICMHLSKSSTYSYWSSKTL